MAQNLFGDYVPDPPEYTSAVNSLRNAIVPGLGYIDSAGKPAASQILQYAGGAPGPAAPPPPPAPATSGGGIPGLPDLSKLFQMPDISKYAPQSQPFGGFDFNKFMASLKGGSTNPTTVSPPSQTPTTTQGGGGTGAPPQQQFGGSGLPQGYMGLNLPREVIDAGTLTGLVNQANAQATGGAVTDNTKLQNQAAAQGFGRYNPALMAAQAQNRSGAMGQVAQNNLTIPMQAAQLNAAYGTGVGQLGELQRSNQAAEQTGTQGENVNRRNILLNMAGGFLK